MATNTISLAGQTSGSVYAPTGNTTIYTNLPFNTAGNPTATNVTFYVPAGASTQILYNQSFRVDSTQGFHELFGNIEVQGLSSDYNVSSWYGLVTLTHKTSGQTIQFQLTKPQFSASNSGVNIEFLDGALAFTSNVNQAGVWTVWATKGGTNTSTWGTGEGAFQLPGTYSPGQTPTDLALTNPSLINVAVNSQDVTNWTGQTTTYTLTSNIETINVAQNGAQVDGTQATFQAGDAIYGKGYTGLSLNLVDKGSVGWTVPNTTVDGIQTINLTNQNSGGTPAVEEVTTLTFQGSPNAATTLTINLPGQNALQITVGNVQNQISANATAAQIAAAVAQAVGGVQGFAALVTGGLANQVVITNENAGAVPDITVTGTLVSGIAPGVVQNQLAAIEVQGGVGFAAGDVVGFEINGATVTTGPIAAAQDISAAIASTINAYFGQNVAGLSGQPNEVVIDAPFVVGITGIRDITNVGEVTSTWTLNQPYLPATPAVPGAPPAVVVTTPGANAVSGADTLNAAAFTGATDFNSNLSTGDVVINNLKTGQSVGIIDNSAVAAGDLTANFGAAASKATLNLSGVSNEFQAEPNVTFTNVTGLTINSNGTLVNGVGELDASAATTVAVNATAGLSIIDLATTGANAKVTVSGSAANTIQNGISNYAFGITQALDADIVGLDASGLTAGGISVLLDANSAATAVVKGGQGNDRIATSKVLTTGSVDAGNGTTDTLVVNANNVVNTAALAQKYSNFEVLENATNGYNVDVSLFTTSNIGSIVLAGGNNGTGAIGLTAAQAIAIINTGNNAGATLALTKATGTSDVLDVTLKNAEATAAADLTGVTVNGFETMRVHAMTGDSAAVNDLGFTGAQNLSSLIIDGTARVKVTTTNLVAAGGTTIDATAIAFAGTTNSPAFEVTGNLVKGSSVLGSNTVDKLTSTGQVAGTQGDFVSYNAKGGNDLIVTTLAAINNTNNGFASLKIDGGEGTDTLETGANTYVDANFQYITNVEALTFVADNATELSLTAGGFFDANFKTNGVTISATALTGDTVVNTATFTGNTKMTLKQDAAALAGDDFTVTTGTGNDQIAVTFDGNQLTAASTISTSNGSDVVTVGTGAALAQNGAITVLLGSGNDSGTSVLNQGANTGAAMTFDGGAGADTLTLVQDANNTITYTLGTGGNNGGTFGAVGQGVASTANTLSATIASGNTVTFSTGVDYVSGFDVLDGQNAHGQLDVVTATTAATSLIGVSSTTALANGTTYVAYGTWNNDTQTFTVAAAFNANTAKDAIVVVGDGNLTAVTTTGIVVMDNLDGALISGNFI